jgi:hypothetical protein
MLKLGLIFTAICIFFTFGYTASDVKFVPNFKGWTLVKHYKFPCQNLSSMPQVVKDLAVMLCPLLTPESEIFVYINPKAKEGLKNGDYPDGVNFAYVVTAVKGVGDIVLFKGHDLGEPKYGVYTLSGKDIEGTGKLLKKATCASCHNVWCKPAGVCMNQKWNTIK